MQRSRRANADGFPPWRNSPMMVASAQFYTPGVRAVHKTEHLSAVFGSITPEIHTHLRHAVHPLAEKSLTQCAWAEIYYRRHREKGQSHADTLRRLGQRWLKITHRMWMNRNLTTQCCTTKISSETALGCCDSKRPNYNLIKTRKTIECLPCFTPSKVGPSRQADALHRFVLN